MQAKKISIGEVCLLLTSGTSDWMLDNFFKANLWFKLGRCFDKLCVICDESSFLITPIFDNEKSFNREKVGGKKSFQVKVRTAYAKSSNPSFELSCNCLRKFAKINVGILCIEAPFTRLHLKCIIIMKL